LSDDTDTKQFETLTQLKMINFNQCITSSKHGILSTAFAFVFF